ncbi:MAG: site-2 protease family protein, partial [Eubacteriales bacterium]
MYIVLALLVFGVLIFVHELGHFVVAKKMGVQVNEFAICMGPVLLEKTVGETRYTLRAIPMGGFCAMEGENEDNGNPRAFTAIAPWKRVLILVAGAFMNFLAG